MAKALTFYCLIFVAMLLPLWQPSLSWLSPVTAMLLLPLGTVWLWHREGRRVSDLGLRCTVTCRRHLGQGFLIGLALPFALTLLLSIKGWATITLLQSSPAQRSPWKLGIPMALLAIVKPALTVLVEELVFRGYFTQRFSFDLPIPWAISLSSLLFALLHIPAMARSELSVMSMLMGLSSWFLLGAALGSGFLRTGNSLCFPWGLHYAYNLSYSMTSVFVSVMHNAPATISYHGPTWLVGHPAWAPESGLLGILLEAAILAIICWFVQHKKQGASET